MVPSNVYSKALYDLAEEIDKNEGCVTCSSVLGEGAAERIDMQTVTIRGLEIQRDELLSFAEEVRRSGDTRLASMAIATIASVKGEQ